MRLRTINIIIFTAMLSLASAGCKKQKPTLPGIEKEISFKKEGILSIHRGDSAIVSDLDIEVAKTEYERETGLMYRTSMKDEQGMLFIFEDEQPRFFYMKNTLISLDIIYINSELKVVSMAENAKPLDESDLPSGQAAKYVLEINGGLASRWNIKEGDSVSFKLQE